MNWGNLNPFGEAPMSIEDEARKLAEYAAGLRPGDSAGFDVDLPFHGQEAKIIEGAQSILRSDDVTGIAFSVAAVGAIRIEA